MRWGWALLGLLTWTGLGACDGGSSTGGRTDSESHWLAQCVDDGDCGALQCLCGVCSTPCDGQACADVAPGAVCAAVCGGAAPQCTAGCEADADCLASGLRCTAGACVAAVQGDLGPALDVGVPDQGVGDMTPADQGQPDQRVDMTAPDQGPPDMALPDMAPPDQGPPAGPCEVPGSTCQGDADCAAGQACAPAALGGPCACLDRPARQLGACGPGECCEDAECVPADARPVVCLDRTLDAQQALCPDHPVDAGNRCAADACLADADCPLGQACVRPGQYGFAVAVCVPRHCRLDADCAERAGGQCTAFMTACAVAGYWCTYADDPCRQDSDCPQRAAPKVCQPEAGGPTQCVDAPISE